MSARAVEILRQCREQLEECALAPIDIDFRDEKCVDCDDAADLIRELRSAEAREAELHARCSDVKNSNKTEYSYMLKEKLVVGKKIKEFSGQINRLLNQSAIMVSNKKRAKIKIDQVADMIRELSDNPGMWAETRVFVPPQTARDRALEKLKTTVQALEEVRCTLQREKVEHQVLVSDLKAEIKATRAELNAIENGTYAPALEFASSLSKMETDQTSDLEGKRRAIQDDIEHLQLLIEKDGMVHISNISSLEGEKVELERRSADMVVNHVTSMRDIQSTLEKLNDERSKNLAVLQGLEKRLLEEREEETLHREMEERRTRDLEERKLADDREYYAALWIQLRWKAYLRRKASRQGAQGKKGSKKGKKGTKE
ncbi:hypothetical protein ACHAW5_003911 [Stephanodiscus triporus]|uniref:Dynein regulatory complex protein 9 n=1 Tax=Stephanodiscus triporus TaxID=2934178 RepID=A0ABD3ML76_9STRA